MEAEASATDIRAVSRAAQVLNLFGPNQPEITTAVVAQQLSMNRTTAYRYCMSLTAAQLLERLDDGRFGPGKILLQLGAFALGRRDILRVAHQHMRALAEATSATAVLSLWGASGPIVSAIAEDPHLIAHVTVRVGAHLSMEAAQTHVFYAFHPDQIYIQRLFANLPPTDHARITEAIHEVRLAGHATTITPRGIAIIAAPIFDPSGLCAALALISTRDAMSVDANSTELRALKRTTLELTTAMGGVVLPIADHDAAQPQTARAVFGVTDANDPTNLPTGRRDG